MGLQLGFEVHHGVLRPAVLAELRRRRGLTQAQLAEAVHVSRGVVARWEQGRAQPRALQAAMLADVLACRTHTLLRF